MNRNIIKTAFVVIVAAMAAACVKEGRSVSPDPEPKGGMDVALRGIIKGYEPLDESKASAENVIRIKWQGGETVYVYEGKDYLGPLTASIEGTDGLYAKLSGHITAPSGGKAITLVYSPKFSARPDEEGKISLDLSTQSDKEVPFLIYSVVDSLEGKNEEGHDISGKVVTFRLATSVYKCNCADLPQGMVSSASIRPINTKCVITLSDDDKPAIGGSDPGTITRTAGFTSADHRAIFSVALTASSAVESRTINITKGGQEYDTAFLFRDDLEAAKAYNAVYVFKPVGALPGKFSVNPSGGQVYFAKGNLWHGEDGYQIEENQWGRQPLKDSIWVINHISHFYWSKTEWYTRQMLYNDISKSTKDVFFTNSTETTAHSDFSVVVDGKEQKGVWRTLSEKNEEGEWYYLLEKRRMTFGKPRYTNGFTGVKIDGLKYRGLFIYPDDYNLDTLSDGRFTWEQINAAGIAFLPAVGIRERDTVKYIVTNQEGLGWYWSSSAGDEDDDKACGIHFIKSGITFDDSGRGTGHSVRLVRDYK